jgi:two-component system chemotaxis response regulator CheY
MSKTVLVIDDSGRFRTVARMALEGAGFEVTEAEDGLDALKKLEKQRFNVITCDTNMPRLDGVGFLQQMKLLPDHKFTPVIMLSTESSDAMKAKTKEAGARAFVTKPFQPSQLIDAVRRLVV